MDLWTKSRTGTYVTEESTLSQGASHYPVICPNCGGQVLKSQRVSVDKDSDGDIAGTHYLHICGAKLLIIND